MFSLLSTLSNKISHKYRLLFQFEALVGGIGGLLGLWIGLSMLSICELFDVALDLWGLFLLRGKREKYKKLVNEEILVPAKPQPVSPETMSAREKTMEDLKSATSRGRGGRRGKKKGTSFLARASLLMGKGNNSKVQQNWSSMIFLI